MPKKPFRPRTKDQISDWLNNFVDKLLDPAKGYATKYNLSAATVTQLDHGRLWMNWALDNLLTSRTAATSLTEFKDQLMGGLLVPSTPVPPVYSVVPAFPLVAGVVSLATTTGSQIKLASHYDLTDGTDLGLEGAVLLPPDPATTRPDLSGLRPASGGQTEVVWVKGVFDSIQLEVDRDDGKGFVFLAIDSEPNYIDTVLPAPGTTATYTYRGIYLLHDAKFGQWSLPVPHTTSG